MTENQDEQVKRSQLSKLIRWSGLANIASAILLLLFWFLFAILLPYRELSTTLAILVLDSDWTFVNVLGVLGSVLGLLGFVGIHLRQLEESGGLGMGGLLTGFVGLTMLAGQLMWETFIWPILARSAPQMLEFQGPLYTSVTFLSLVGTGGLLFSVGFLLTGIAAMKAGSLPRLPALLSSIGAPLFGLGALSGGFQVIVRSAGIVLFAAGIVWIGLLLWKE